MGRIVAIDYGSKRVGLAVTDPMQIIATALETVEASKILPYLKAYQLKEGIELFVIGMPRRLDNTDSENAPRVRKFITFLNKEFPDIKVVEVDERFTTSIALDTMIAGGMKKKDRRDKSNVDKISATIILQSYLQHRELRG